MKLSKPQIDDVDADDTNDRNDGFFEAEAELSGSERESDEDDDGDDDADADDDSIIFKGDDNELPAEDELRDQLGKIYL